MSVECHNLMKSYKKRRILDKLSFSVNTPGVMCIVGPNGSGKTTLLRVLAGFESADAGQVVYFGKNFTRDAIRTAGITFASQHPVILNRSVLENLAYPLQLRSWNRKHISLQVNIYLISLGLEHLKYQNALSLSAGEKQKLALGRALIGKPRVLLLDEPTANIDIETKDDIEQLLLSAVDKYNCHIIMSTHQRSQAERLGRQILRLDADI